MRTFSLGKTGIEVSALCLGAMYFGTRLRPRPGASFAPQLVANDDLLDYYRQPEMNRPSCLMRWTKK